jgi:hypothetical protein
MCFSEGMPFIRKRCIALYATCQKADQVMDDLSGAQLKQAQPITVTVPFEAELIGMYTGFFSPGDPDFTCGPQFGCRVLVDAKGTATPMGNITTRFDFCACGGGFTDDFNRDSYPANCFHHWTGTITLVKGKR